MGEKIKFLWEREHGSCGRGVAMGREVRFLWEGKQGSCGRSKVAMGREARFLWEGEQGSCERGSKVLVGGGERFLCERSKVPL